MQLEEFSVQLLQETVMLTEHFWTLEKEQIGFNCRSLQNMIRNRTLPEIVAIGGQYFES